MHARTQLYRTDKDDAMQVCETYQIHKTELWGANEALYDECQVSPDVTGIYYEL